MDELNNIGQLFRDKFKGHTIEPSDKVWANIQKNIGSSPVAQPKGKFTKYIVSGAAAVALIVASVAVAYFLNPEQKNTSTPPKTNIENKTNNSIQPISTVQPLSTETIVQPSNTQNIVLNNTSTIVSNTVPSNKNTTSTNPFVDNKLVISPNKQTNTNNFVENIQPKVNPVVQNNNNITPVAKTDLGEETPKTNITLDISRDTTVCNGQPVTLKINGGISVVWSDGSTSDEKMVIPYYTYGGSSNTYMALVHTLNGDTAITIRVNTIDCSNREQPNAFTPNGDGINDVFKPNLEFSYDYSIMIYSRSGVKVYESNDYNKGWDGKFNNEEQPEGAYFYVILYRQNTNGTIKTIRGSVVLLRRQ